MAMATRKNTRKNTRKAGRKANRKTTRKQTGGRKMNPYMKFAQKERPKILHEHPELRSDVVAVARKIGEKWRSLSPKDKARF